MILFKKLKLPFLRSDLYCKKLAFIQLLAFFMLAFIIFYLGHPNNLVIYAARDISRAGAWLAGDFFWPGPEMSGGNNLPGPFFYFLLFPAFLLGESIYSQTVLWAVIWLSLTYTIAFLFVSKITLHTESLLIFLINFIITMSLTFYNSILNPEFAILFHVLILMGLYYWREQRNSLYLYLTGLIIALGVQVHLLTLLHILTVFLFYAIDRSDRKKIKALLLFLLLAFSPILIYSLLKYFHFFETSENYYKGYIEFIFKDIFSEKWLDNMKRLSFYMSAVAFCGALTLWHKYKTKKWLIKKTTKNLFIIIIPLFLIVSLGARQNWYLSFFPIFFIIFISKLLDDLLPANINKKARLLLVYSFFSAAYIFISSWQFIPLNFYHSLLTENKLAFFASFLSIIFAISRQQPKKWIYKTTLISLYIFTFIQVIAFNTYKNYTQPKQDFSTVWPSFKELYPLMKKIQLETNWPAKTAMKRIFNVGIHLERSLLADYSMAVEQNKITPIAKQSNKLIKQSHLKTEEIQGYFIIQHLKKFIDWRQENWRNHLAQSSLLPLILKKEIKTERIIIHEPKLYNSFWLIPYKTTKSSLFPEGFHNIGQPYYWEEPEWLKNCNKSQTFKNEQSFFYCKIFDKHLQKAGLELQFSEKERESFINIQFFGPLLGIINFFTNLNGSLLWSDIQMHLSCNEKKLQWKLPNIGNDTWDVFYSIEKQAQILLAPLKLRIPLKECKKSNIKKITLSFIEKHTYSKNNKVTISWKN